MNTVEEPLFHPLGPVRRDRIGEMLDRGLSRMSPFEIETRALVERCLERRLIAIPEPSPVTVAAPTPGTKPARTMEVVRHQIKSGVESPTEIMRRTGLSNGTVHKYLSLLQKLNLAVSKNGRWLAVCLLLLPMLATAGPLDYLLTNRVTKAAAAAPVAYSATFAWDASTDTGVTNYTLFWGGKSGMYTNSVSTGTNRVRQVVGFAEGKYFAAVRANARGTNSPFSNEIGFTLGPTNAPRIITLSVESKDISVPGALWIERWRTQYNGTIGNEIYRAHAR